MRFEWDPQKTEANLRLHGVSFAEAVTIFEDDFALSREDDDPARSSASSVSGWSDAANLLVVVYAYRDPDVIRVISAWKANKHQRELYEEGRS